jgi:hypothetical protein
MRRIVFSSALVGFYDDLLNEIELEILRQAKVHDANSLHLLDTVPGIGKILSLVILYEVHDIGRFPTVQDFASYCRLVKAKKESAGKVSGSSASKIGNANLKWAFSEAAVGFLWVGFCFLDSGDLITVRSRCGIQARQSTELPFSQCASQRL